MAVRSKRNKSNSTGDFLRVRHTSNIPDVNTRNIKNHKPIRRKTTVANTIPAAIPKRGRPRKQIVEERESSIYKRLATEPIDKRIRSNHQWDNMRNGVKRERGRPKKYPLGENLRLCNSLSQGPYKSRHRLRSHEFNAREVVRPKQSECDQEVKNEALSEISEYELQHNKRREELLLMFRKLFAVESTSESSEKLSVSSDVSRPRKYSKKPLPPARPRSLRLQGLQPGQRSSLRRRRYTNRPRCLCCLVSQSPQSHS